VLPSPAGAKPGPSSLRTARLCRGRHIPNPRQPPVILPDWDKTAEAVLHAPHVLQFIANSNANHAEVIGGPVPQELLARIAQARRFVDISPKTYDHVQQGPVHAKVAERIREARDRLAEWEALLCTHEAAMRRTFLGIARVVGAYQRHMDAPHLLASEFGTRYAAAVEMDMVASAAFSGLPWATFGYRPYGFWFTTVAAPERTPIHRCRPEDLAQPHFGMPAPQDHDPLFAYEKSLLGYDPEHPTARQTRRELVRRIFETHAMQGEDKRA
jgi:hypothetical protein